jgi:hypothetical protein
MSVHGYGGSDPAAREAHQQAVFAAIQATGEFQGVLNAAKEQWETAIGLVANCTGGNMSSSEAGRNAFSMAAQMPDMIDELYSHTYRIVAELERYQGGF